MTGMTSNNVVGSNLDNNSNLKVAIPAKGNQSDKENLATAMNAGSDKKGLLATLKIIPPQTTHSSSSSSYSSSLSGSSNSDSYSYSSSGTYSNSRRSSVNKNKVQNVNKTTLSSKNDIVVSNTHLDNNRGNEQYSSSSSYSY